MAPWLILAVGGVYLWTALEFLKESQGGMALVFFAYALANLGLYIATK